MVIGGAGLIGSHLVEQLLATDVAEVLVYDDFSRGRAENLPEHPRLRLAPHGGNILHTDLLERAMEGMDAVFHLAALWLLQCHEYPEAAFEVNVRGTFNVAMAAIRKKVQKVVYSSSASVYGDALEIPMTEEHPYNNRTFYGATKIAGEHLLASLGHRYGLDWVGLRYMNVYGPRQDYKGAYVAVMMKMLDAIDAGERPVVYGDGSQQYDFVEVSDVARANLLALLAPVSGRCYNVGRGLGTTIDELARLLLRLTGSSLEVEYRPAGQTFVTNRIGCPKAAEQDLGFRWSVDLEEGMARLIEWRRRDRCAAS